MSWFKWIGLLCNSSREPTGKCACNSGTHEQEELALETWIFPKRSRPNEQRFDPLCHKCQCPRELLESWTHRWLRLRLPRSSASFCSFWLASQSSKFGVKIWAGSIQKEKNFTWAFWPGDMRQQSTAWHFIATRRNSLWRPLSKMWASVKPSTTNANGFWLTAFDLMLVF